LLSLNKSKSGISKTISIVVAVVIVVAAIVGVLYALSGPLSVSFGVATSTSVGTAGSAVSFSVLPSASGTTVSSVF
jgi:flagellar basal body-associated protein FliL